MRTITHHKPCDTSLTCFVHQCTSIKCSTGSQSDSFSALVPHAGTLLSSMRLHGSSRAEKITRVPCTLHQRLTRIKGDMRTRRKSDKLLRYVKVSPCLHGHNRFNCCTGSLLCMLVIPVSANEVSAMRFVIPNIMHVSSVLSQLSARFASSGSPSLVWLTARSASIKAFAPLRALYYPRHVSRSSRKRSRLLPHVCQAHDLLCGARTASIAFPRTGSSIQSTVALPLRSARLPAVLQNPSHDSTPELQPSRVRSPRCRCQDWHVHDSDQRCVEDT